MYGLSMPPSSSNLIDEPYVSRIGGAEASGSALSLEHEILSLFDLLRVPLLRYAVSFGLSLHDGEDIIQEVFLALFHHLQEGRSRSNLRGWVFRVAHNLALKRRATNQRRYGIDEGDCHFVDECS